MDRGVWTFGTARLTCNTDTAEAIQTACLAVERGCRCQAFCQPVEVNGLARPILSLHTFGILGVPAQGFQQERINLGPLANPVRWDIQIVPQPSNRTCAKVESQLLSNAPLFRHRLAFDAVRRQNIQMVRQGISASSSAEILSIQPRVPI